jgi:Heparinase II/III N-terminus/Heparinase II/III-like protein
MSALFLKTPYQSWSAEEILSYYQIRKHINYFSLRDEEQAGSEKIAGVLENRFDFNDESYQLPHSFDWTKNPSNDKEWLILLHKFYYAVGLGEEFVKTGNEKYVKKWLELTNHFIDTVPVDFLSCDVIGRRVQNWIFAYYYFIGQCETQLITPEFYMKFLGSLYTQVSYLCEHLTPARNHRTIELYAIFMAAVIFPEFKDAERWLEFSKRELASNLQNDLLEDGVQCELSTDYHMLVLRNYLGIMNLARLNRIAMPAEMDTLIKKALEFALYIHKPDGMIPSLSDGDSRNFLSVLKQGYELYGDERLLYATTQGRQGQAPRERSKLFNPSGYTVLRSGWGTKENFTDERFLIFDCGPLGAGNHGHLDVLNFEMAAYGQSLIVDPGRYTYNEPPQDSPETNWRKLFRGTSYHNTVQVDGLEQTPYLFHKTRFKIRGPAPEHTLQSFITDARFDYLHGIARSHQYEASHERKIVFACSEYFIISDSLEAKENHSYDLRFHLSDAAFGNATTLLEDDTLLVHAPHLVLAQPNVKGITISLEDGFISRTYGIKHPAPIVRVSQEANRTSFHTVLYPFKELRPSISIKRLPVEHQHSYCHPNEAFALEIMIRNDKQTTRDIYFNAVAAKAYTFGGIRYDGSLLFLRETKSKPQVIHQQAKATLTINNKPVFSTLKPELEVV